MKNLSKKKQRIYEESLFRKKKKKNKKAANKAMKKDLKRAKKRAKYTLTLDEVKKLIPSNYRGIITPKLVDNINETLLASSTGSDLKEHIVGFADVLADGRYSIQQYVSAVQYVHFRLMEFSAVKAYRKSHNASYQKWVKVEKLNKKQIKGRVSSYNRGKLVQSLFAQCMIPAHQLFQDYYYKAIKRQSELMTDPNGIVAQRAADSLMTHLAPPPETEGVLDVGSAGAGIVKELFANFALLADKQSKAIEKGEVTPKELIQANLVKADYRIK